jgi:hypothetical protein
MNEETLILYYYNDGLTDSERREVEVAIDSDPSVGQQYETLCRELNELADPDIPAVPRHIVDRWHQVVDDAARQPSTLTRTRQRFFRPATFAWGAALAAALVIGVNLRPTVVEPNAIVPAETSAAFVRGVQLHFRDTYDELAGLSVDSTDDRMVLVMQIVEKNRMYESAANQNGADDLARVLRAFEPVLIRLAAEDTAPEDAKALRAKLVFELNVMLTKLSRESSNDTDTASTGIQT